uniref:Uncharacterized protein n=1 Tax=Caenorhabditis japonica TaxID=281687 RepID=A0A8R1HWJ4_CAEJA
MSKIETWELLERTDDTMTFLFRRRPFDDSSDEFKKSQRSEKTKSEMDEHTRSVIESLSELNTHIRKKHRLEKRKKYARKEKKGISEKKYSKKPEEEKPVEKKSDEDVKTAKPEPCDHRGVPLSHPMAMTPYPGRTTAAQREKARKMLNELAIRMRNEEIEKSKMKEKKENTSTSADSSEKADDSNKSSKAPSSRSKNSCLSDKTMGCDKCGSCQKCVLKCSKKHAVEQKVSNAERENFLKSMRKLREKIQNPEKTRECGTKSPYDVTQSDSEADVSTSNSEKHSTKKWKKGKKSAAF